MYTLALAILIGFVAAQVTNLVVDLVPALNKIPVLNRENNMFILVTILTVWLTDTSLLATYGIGNSAQWVDVVGSGLAIVGITSVVDAFARYFEK
jgi:hypothetical protein